MATDGTATADARIDLRLTEARPRGEHLILTEEAPATETILPTDVAVARAA